MTYSKYRFKVCMISAKLHAFLPASLQQQVTKPASSGKNVLELSAGQQWPQVEHGKKTNLPCRMANGHDNPQLNLNSTSIFTVYKCSLVNLNLVHSQTESGRYHSLFTLHYMFIKVVIYMYMYLLHKFFKCKLYSFTCPSTVTEGHNNLINKFNTFIKQSLWSCQQNMTVVHKKYVRNVTKD